ncbi:2-hydroxyhepta-2,4-diene-1,7-dioate isomerase [Paraburkholderia sp. Tr-20389]|uniref:fumarylacetoacetate hydrolase family protein n=1 Tax=Paraburkholderia sp. Tr-20389 TaxID=2703903 RepID=UPI00197E1A05|nr:fumarylacetoacetate hydrolase family protein [Paraburkholderia sp. Tr-20389]MBN3753161.1 2-hydroxyhepta-2,4-diene-1,7-dioate isomerase [Paraburkholderia sp. Tr-20389]
MFALHDHLIHLEAEPLARDSDARTVRALLANGAACTPPVTGAVYGTLLNDRAALDALGDAVNAAPYKAPPKAPVLYVKPRNTFAGHRASITVPNDDEGVQVGGSLGIVIGRTACRVSVEHALEYVAGYTIVADLCVPHESVYRPSVRFRARDGFCVLGPAAVARRHVDDPDALPIAIRIEGQAPFNATTTTWIRNVARLIADVTEFMTLAPGDVLTMGVPHGAPIAHAGDEISIAIGEMPPLCFSMKAKAEGGER